MDYDDDRYHLWRYIQDDRLRQSTQKHEKQDLLKRLCRVLEPEMMKGTIEYRIDLVERLCRVIGIKADIEE
jgi:hypothetical protein